MQHVSINLKFTINNVSFLVFNVFFLLLIVDNFNNYINNNILE